MDRWSIRRGIFVGGSIAGALDILFAITFAYTNGGPDVVAQLRARHDLGNRRVG